MYLIVLSQTVFNAVADSIISFVVFGALIKLCEASRHRKINSRLISQGLCQCILFQIFGRFNELFQKNPLIITIIFSVIQLCQN